MMYDRNIFIFIDVVNFEIPKLIYISEEKRIEHETKY